MKMLATLIAITLASSAVAHAAPSALEPIPGGLPAGERFALGSGLTVVLVPNPANPWLELHLGFRAGGGADPAGKEGLASLLGRMLTAGTPELPEQALAEELARLGATIAPDVGMDSFVLSGQIPTFSDETTKRFLDIFFDAALWPTLPADILEREKTLRRGLLRRIGDNPEALVEIAAKLAAYGDGPFGRTTLGSLASIARIERADVAAFHAALFNPRHGVLVIGGAFDPKAMRAWLERRFDRCPYGIKPEERPASCRFGDGQQASAGALPGRFARLCATPSVPCGKEGGNVACTGDVAPICFDNPLADAAPVTAGLPGPRTIHVVIDDAGLTQIPFRLVGPNPITMVDPRWPAFRVGTFVLGGDFTSRLNALLRTKEGLTYGAYFQPAFGGHASGAMSVSTDATPDALPKAVSLAKREVDRLRTEPVPKDELATARAMMVNGFAFKFETLSNTLEQYLTLELASVPLSWLASWRDVLARPNAEQIRQSMAVLDPMHLALVVVGPADLAATVARLGHGPVTTVSAADLIATGLP